MADKPFRYPFEALLRKRQADWKTVKQEEATASRVVERNATQVNEARSGVEQTEELLRQARQDGTRIDAAQQQVLASYLKYQRAELEQRQRALKQARDVHERVRVNLENAGRGVKSLEKHRAGREAEHRFAQGIVEQNRLDEMWLVGGGRKPDADL